MNTKRESAAVNFIAAFCACVLIISAVFAFVPMNGEQKIFSDMIRLHVLANSNSQEDQDLKFQVRDYILSDIAQITKGSSDSAEAAERIRLGLNDIETRVRGFIAGKGYNHTVSAVFSREMHPRRIYTDAEAYYIFPAGIYNSLSIRIGESAGENWWCVLFPPLCFSAGMRIDDALAVAGYTDQQIKLLKRDRDGGSGNRFEVRLKILELLTTRR